MTDSRYSQIITILDKQNVNLEAEKQRALQKREELIKSFEQTFIYDDKQKLKKNIKVKNYVDGSRYEVNVNNNNNNHISI